MNRVLLHRRLPRILAVLASILGVPSLFAGFQADDFLHRVAFLQPAPFDTLFVSPIISMYEFADGDPERTGRMVELGLYPWSTAPELKIHLGRPLTVLTHSLDYLAWPDSPALMHAHNLLWFALAVFLVACLYRQIMGVTSAAGLAALLFVLDDTHALQTGWIANRNSLIAISFGTAALLFHHAWRSRSLPRLSIASVACFAASLLAKESAVAVAGYVVSYALLIDRSRGRSRLFSTLPYLVTLIAWKAAYDSAGFGAAHSAAYIDPMREPLDYLAAVAYRVPLLLNAQFAFPPTDFYTFSPPAAGPFLIGWAVLALAILSPWFLHLLKHDRIARFWFLGALLSTLPACSAGLMDRLLDFCGIGAMGFLGRLLFASGEATRGAGWFRSERGWKYVKHTLMGIHLAVAPVMFVVMLVLFSYGNRLLTDTALNVLPVETEIEEKTVVLANVGNYPIGTYFIFMRALEGRPLPRSVRSIASPTVAATPLKVERLSLTTLRVMAEGDGRPSLFRDQPAFADGSKTDLGDIVVEVESINEDGWPASMLYHFDVPLEDESLLWIEVLPSGPEFWNPPAVGETVMLNRTTM